MTGNPITKDEIKNAIRQLNKAVGNYEIAFELIEALGMFGLEKITDVANFVYESANVPYEMTE